MSWASSASPGAEGLPVVDIDPELGQRPGRERLGPRWCEQRRELVEAGVVTDQQHAFEVRSHDAEALEEIVGPRVIEPAFDLHLGCAQRRSDEIERRTRSYRSRAQHEVGTHLVLGRPLPHALARLAAPRGERAIVIGEPGLVPARLEVTEEPESLHRPCLQPRTSATWPVVSGDGRRTGNVAPQLGDPRDRVAAVEPVPDEPAADHCSRPPDAPPAVHVDGASVLAHGVDVIEDLHHVPRGRRAHVRDRVGDPARAVEKPLVARRVGRTGG